MAKPCLLLIGNFLSASVGTRSVGEDLADRLAGIGYPVIKTSSRKGKIVRMLDMGITILCQRRIYDLAYLEVYSTLAFLWAEVCTRLLTSLHKPFVLVLHGGGLPDLATQNPSRVHRLLSQTKFVVTPSLFVQTKLSSFCPVIRYLPNAIDLSRYSFRLQDQAEPRLIWLRAFHEIYNPEMAVLVLAEVVKTHPDATLTLIGPDKKDGSMERTIRLIEDFKLVQKVFITGPIPKLEIPAELNKGGIFLNTTRFESFGVSVMEAAACGLPIVSTNVGELSYLWRNGEDAILVPSDDPKAMGEAVLRILSEPDLSGKLSASGKKRAEQFDWQIILPMWDRLFQQVLNRE